MTGSDLLGSSLAALGSMVAIEVLRPGFLTTVQDRGRIGYQKFGVPVSGAVDGIALRVGNTLVGNPQDASALEITAVGPQLRLLADAVLALTGAEVDVDLDGEAVPWYQSFLVRSGQILDIRSCTRGLRTYLAVAGGIEVPIVLGSRSTCLAASFGGFCGRPLLAGDVLPVGPPPGRLADLANRGVPEVWRPRHGLPATVRVVLGPQDDAFAEEGRRTLLDSLYRITQHTDRMGCRLDGPAIPHQSSADIISDWVPLGGVQVPGDQRPIVLLADRQTTGGYPKIATVIGPDVSLVGQCRPGDTVRFRTVSMAEAQAMAREVEAALAALPARLVRAESWTYAAEQGEVPGSIPVVIRGRVPQGVSKAGIREDGETIRCPMPSVVAKVLVTSGDVVAAGQTMVILQAMKMEHPVVAPEAGRIVGVHVGEGDALAAGDPVVTIEPGG